MRRLAFLLLCLVALLAAAPGLRAQAILTSAAPDSVAVTIYRDPDRDADDEMDLGWLEGYALITEKRTVTIPAGQSVIRFEGVAAGMLPESALIAGLPTGVREKNLDAELLSPRNLYARAFGRPVILRRQNRTTGKTTEERAIIRSSPDGAIIVQTKDGFENAQCGPLNESLIYDGVPEGLSARPTLSVATDSPAEARVTLSLSYLAWGFDWDASYVIRMKEGNRSASLYAWVTLASSDPTSFADADMAVVAGGANREGERDYDRAQNGELVLQCAITPLLPPPAVVGLAPPPPPFAGAEEIIVTGQRRREVAMNAPVKVVEEGLGDLKLYRMPVATTVAANAQKQVTLHDLPEVKFSVIYGTTIWDGDASRDVSLLLRSRNRKEDGLGVALPTGTVNVFEPHGDTDLLVGQGSLEGRAVGEDVELTIAESSQVEIESDVTDRGKGRRDIELVVTNANPWPVAFEALVRADERRKQDRFSSRMGRKNGQPLWKVEVPANGTATLRYRLTELDD